MSDLSVDPAGLAGYSTYMTTTKNTRWNRNERGSGDRYQMRAYAVEVTFALTGGTCPLTGEALDLTNFEVDKVTPALGYVPGNVVAVSVAGNQGRAAMQSIGSDLAGFARYAADVARASATVEVPTVANARRTVAGWGKPDYRAAVVAGPYGG